MELLEIIKRSVLLNVSRTVEHQTWLPTNIIMDEL